MSRLLAASQLIGVLTAAVTGGDASVAAAVTANATQYNNLDHPSAERLLKELQGCRATEGCSAATIREIVGRYEQLSAQRSMAIDACRIRVCVEAIQKSAISLETPVAKDLMDFLRRNISYDMAGLLTGNPGLIAIPSQGVDPWGALFTSDKQMAFAKYVKEGWLTPGELAGVDQWVKDTSWLDQQAGRQLSLQDRSTMMTELISAAGMAIIGRSTAGTGVGGGAKGNQLINGKWVDAEGLPLPVPSSVGASGRVPNVLQTGGNTLNKSTANALNEHFGENLAPREWGRALEALKADAGKLPNNFHGRILDNGDYVGKGGEVIGNIRDYLP